MITNNEADKKLRIFDSNARDEFNKLPKEKKEKSLKAKSFIIFPFEVHYNQNKSFEEKVGESLILIENHLKEYNNVFVSTSHGMDSVVLCHLVLSAWKKLKRMGYNKPKPEFWLNNTLNIYKEEPEYWKLINKHLDIEDTFREFKPPLNADGNRYTVWNIADKVGHLPSFRRQSVDRKDKSGSKGLTPECCDILKKKSIKSHLKEMHKQYQQSGLGKKFDCHFIGTRAEESRIRKLGVMQRCRSYTIKTQWPYPIRACTPLSYWMFKDIERYYDEYNIPKNPTYEIHNMKRMGCASCPAHRLWELRLLRDPTSEGIGMLKQNFKILSLTEKDRLQESVKALKRILKTKKYREQVPESNHLIIKELIEKYEL